MIYSERFMNSASLIPLTHCRKHGETYRLVRLQGPENLVERLRELGLHSGIEVEYAGRAPFSGPQLLRIGPTLIALRTEEAACVLLSL